MSYLHVFFIMLALIADGPLCFNGKKLILSNKEWKERLTAEQYVILRKGGTEPPFSGKYDDFKESGTYVCAGCQLPLFSSKEKYDSGTGWPSFWAPICSKNVMYKDDYFFFQKRVEVLCARCEGHLGHVFDDGPPPTGKRYCINSAALLFQAAEHELSNACLLQIVGSHHLTKKIGIASSYSAWR